MTIIKVLVSFLIISISVSVFAEGNSESVGTYNNGCMIYPSELPQNGEGYRSPRFSRRHNFANPEMLKFIDDLSYRVKEKYGKQILVSDISKNNGGPIPFLHSSHQTGLDADIWYRLYDPQQNLTQDDLENLQPVNMVSKDWKNISEFWSVDNEDILRTAAQDSKVDRIFVNPVIKKQFCSKYKNEPWQAKIRPWWRHNEHFHVRLKCPANSPECEMKGDPIKGSGCDGTLDWWFSEEAKLPKTKKEAEGKITEEEIFSRLPERCKEVLKDEMKEE